MTFLFRPIRSQLVIWAVLLALAGCATQRIAPPAKPTHFVTVIPEGGKSLSSIAQHYLGDSNLSFRISEFNDVDASSPNQPLVVPLKPMYPYGARRTGLQTVPILSYHAFSWRTPDVMTVRKKDFEAQMRYLKTNGYHVVPLSRMLDLFNGGELPEKSVVITIDDGWGSTYRIAYPILRKYGYPFTLFIQTDLINSAQKTLDWDKIREMMKNSNITVGCHTKAHRDLTLIKPGESFAKYFSSIRRELSLAKKIILRETGIDPIHLAYPYGKTNQLVMDLMKGLGYSTGYTINRRANSLLTDPFKLNRSMIYGTYELAKFQRQLSTFDRLDSKTKRLTEEITLSQPSESTAQLLEDKGYWREALNHWRLIKDSLLQKAEDDHSGLRGQKPPATGRKSIVSSGEYEKKIASAEQRIEKLENRTEEAANDHYEKGISNFAERKTSLGIRHLVKALYFNPGFTEARSRLSQQINKPDYLVVSVRDGDTSKSIARQTYKNTAKSFLVSYYADMQGGLIPGMRLNLPKIPRQQTLSDSPSKAMPIAGNECGVTLNKPKNQLAKDFFAKGELFFNKDQIGKAIEALKTSVCLDPEYSSAAELLQLLNGLNN